MQILDAMERIMVRNFCGEFLIRQQRLQIKVWFVSLWLELYLLSTFVAGFTGHLDVFQADMRCIFSWSKRRQLAVACNLTLQILYYTLSHVLRQGFTMPSHLILCVYNTHIHNYRLAFPKQLEWRRWCLTDQWVRTIRLFFSAKRHTLQIKILLPLSP